MGKEPKEAIGVFALGELYFGPAGSNFAVCRTFERDGNVWYSALDLRQVRELRSELDRPEAKDR